MKKIQVILPVFDWHKDGREICLDTAELQMLAYEHNRGDKSARAYLHIAEANLAEAQRMGRDTIKQYERLQTLQSESLQR